MPKTLYVIDGHSQIHRAYHTKMRGLTAPGGEPTKAVYLFCKMLFGLVRSQRPDYLALAMDTKREKLLRRKWFPRYKLNRVQSLPGLVDQIKLIHRIVELLGIPVLKVTGYEADDVMATLTRQARRSDPPIDVVLITKDKDAHQLIRGGGPEVRLFDPKESTYFTKRDVFNKWGLWPSQMIDFQTMAGDTTDGVPGVRGIGPKTARKLLKRYGSLQSIMDHIGDLPNNVAQMLDTADLELARKLVTLEQRLDLGVEMDDLVYRGIDTRRVRPLFRKLGFRRWANW